MLIEIAVLYAVYAISGALVVNTTVAIVGDIVTTSSKSNGQKYVACQANPKNDAKECKGLE
jgi:hypothetical protein